MVKIDLAIFYNDVCSGCLLQVQEIIILFNLTALRSRLLHLSPTPLNSHYQRKQIRNGKIRALAFRRPRRFQCKVASVNRAWQVSIRKMFSCEK